MINSNPPGDSTMLVHAYLDGELDPANALEIERRMAGDPALAAEYKKAEALQRSMRERLPREAAPDALRARVEAMAKTKQPSLQPSWRSLAASVLITAMVAGGGGWFARGPQTQDTLRDAIVTGHIRSLMASQPADVLSSDQHTVKPWFNGRVPGAPRVVDLGKQDFPLAGGRLDVVERMPVPTLVYRHRKHLISLTAIPAAGRRDTAPTVGKTDGYNIVHWTEGETSYWAISDLDAGDLGRFVQLFRTGAPEL